MISSFLGVICGHRATCSTTSLLWYPGVHVQSTETETTHMLSTFPDQTLCLLSAKAKSKATTDEDDDDDDDYWSYGYVKYFG